MHTFDWSTMMAVICVGLPLLAVFSVLKASLTSQKHPGKKITTKPAVPVWRDPPPFTVNLPSATAFDTIAAEVPTVSFWNVNWQCVDFSPGDKVCYSAHLKAFSTEVNRSAELQLKVELRAVSKFATRLIFSFVHLGGSELDSEQAAVNIRQRLEDSLRMKLALVATLYRVVNVGAVLTGQIGLAAGADIASAKKCLRCQHAVDYAFAFCLHCGATI